MRVLIIDDRDAEVFRDRLVNWSTLDSEVDQVEVETTLIGDQTLKGLLIG